MSAIAMTVTHDGVQSDVEAAKIGGRGDPAEMNWGGGDGDSFERAEAAASELAAHRGEPVVLTGGGGHGWDLAILEDVAVGQYAGGYKPKAFLTLVYGKRAGLGWSDFAPWIDSWHLSAFTDPDDLALVTEWVETYRDD